MLQPSTNDIIKIIRTYAYQNGMSMSEFAKKAGVSKAWLSKLKHGDREISLQLAQKILHAAGYTIVLKHDQDLSEADKKNYQVIGDSELDKKDKENSEVNKLIDKNKKLLDNEQHQAAISKSRLKKVLSNQE